MRGDASSACQRTIAQQVVEAEGDYALALKGNQGTLYEDVRLLLDDPEAKVSTVAPEVEGDHGRVETRTALSAERFNQVTRQHWSVETRCTGGWMW